MRKINKEFKEMFDKLAKDLHDKKEVKSGVHKSKQNRVLRVEDNDLCLRYHGHVMVSYYTVDNSLFLDSCGHGCTPSTKELLNTFCPRGYRFYSKGFISYAETPTSTFSQCFAIYNYL